MFLAFKLSKMFSAGLPPCTSCWRGLPPRTPRPPIQRFCPALRLILERNHVTTTLCVRPPCAPQASASSCRAGHRGRRAPRLGVLSGCHVLSLLSRILAPPRRATRLPGTNNYGLVVTFCRFLAPAMTPHHVATLRDLSATCSHGYHDCVGCPCLAVGAPRDAPPWPLLL